MQFLHEEIGSAKDNLKSPIHNWYKFTAGFSHKFVDEIIKSESLRGKDNAKIFDPFAGCGTTLVSCQKSGIPAVGNEGQEFMYDIIRAKLLWKIEDDVVEDYLEAIRNYVSSNVASFDMTEVHPLLATLYEEIDLRKLYLIKRYISNFKSYKYRLFFKLALSQTLHKVSIHPIAVPYIARNKTLSNMTRSWDFFESISRQMLGDVQSFKNQKKTSKIFLHDSRQLNTKIEDNECSTCITSPPYLNNLDYGEVSKVHSHFFGHTDDWNDVTKKVRKKLVTGATTHYIGSDFDLDIFKSTQFYLENKKLAESLFVTARQIKAAGKLQGGKKSFDLLTLFYFFDMHSVLRELRRVIAPKGRSYLILGDSAPYGVHIPTTEILGNISKSLGFKTFEIHKIRSRGTKWKTLTHRHSLELSENVLVLK
jgi:DNA modification methylase